ncbi:hypothetical protein [Duganella vulcania]|uniref:Tyrosine specific protein phosphatases domain-containing protein n=1 Tax=Duganella vulcania TaxID=2692166 RepID=A0A845GH94_9BURK|nr:hypothetical protein [Duganella vulcania]MYM92775.1 hypothetical protein [Duganella vulcania]
MIESVAFMSEKAACALEPRPGTALLSISNPGVHTVPLQEGWSPLLRVYFPDAGCDAGMLNFLGGYDKYLALGFPNHEHALAMRAFIESLRQSSSPYHLLVHCHAGRSRSVAVAKYVADLCSLPLEGDLSRLNETVLNLMRDPYYYAPVGYAHQVQLRPSAKHRLLRFFGLAR